MKPSGMRLPCEPLVAAGSAMVSDDATTVRYSARSEMAGNALSACSAGNASERSHEPRQCGPEGGGYALNANATQEY